MIKFTQKFLCIFLFMALCVFATNAGAEQELRWPVKTRMMCKDWIDGAAPDDWVDVGEVIYLNTRGELKIKVIPDEGFKLEKVNIHVVEYLEEFDRVIDKKGKPVAGKFDYKTDYLGTYGYLADDHMQVIPFEELIPKGESAICWGVDPEKCPPNRYVIVRVELYEQNGFNEDGTENWVDIPQSAYSQNFLGIFDRIDKEEAVWAWYVTYPLAKVERGHFIDANVKGLTYETPTQSGVTGDSGQFDFIPEERVAFSVGSLPLGDALGDRRVSPMDLFGGADLEDDRVLNVARLVQSLDADGNPAQGGINITEPVIACLESALPGTLPEPEDFFADDEAVGLLIDATVAACAGEVALTAVTKEEALDNLNSGQQAANLMKRNISKTPDMKSDKAKIEIMPVYVPAQRPDGSPTEVVYHDADGNVIETRGEAKPIVVTYLDEDEDTGALDVFAAISRDDGDTWKRRNLSKTAGKSSLVDYPGESYKPMLKVKDNKIFVAWTDKYCRGGRPGYAIEVCPDTDGDGQPDPCEICRETAEGTVCTLDYPGDDAYWADDLYGVGGPQRSVIYEDYPEKGEVPYSCVWAARGVIEPATGEVQWF
ncbi:MAG: hypothetical protein JRF38_25715, partial [Deltaproteobacteria bacterium]|nr:hypothetical protein [Deltaproteobacteria bacterium]